MKKVFFGGSRNMGKLNQAVKIRIDKVIENNLSVFIGDANGADKGMQNYLAERSYENVRVFCSGSECRNNIGGWPTCQIVSNQKKKDFQFYTAKDTVMSDEADYGFMLWDGMSKGTLNNILNLIERGKQVVVYYLPEKEFITLRVLADIKPLLSKCAPEVIRRFDKNIDLHKRISSQSQLNLA